MQSQSEIVERNLPKPLPIPVRPNRSWGSPIDRKIYQMLKEQGPLTRPELVELLRLPRTTLHDALTRLNVRGLIVRFTEPRGSRGRRPVFFKIAVE
ncbi:MAG: winged helix-turn-helix transcriptional regulator [Candidatus Hodarchaeales archaeon]